jgi:hypothetical protein
LIICLLTFLGKQLKKLYKTRTTVVPIFGSFHTNYIIFRNVDFFKKMSFLYKYFKIFIYLFIYYFIGFGEGTYHIESSGMFLFVKNENVKII